MEPEFWLAKWQSGKIGFHKDGVHPDLVAHSDWLLPGGVHRVLVPLCGKSWDLFWLAERGHRVVGVELAEAAVRALHEEHGRRFTTRPVGPFVVHETEDLPCAVLCGNVFELTPALLERVFGGLATAVWDRAALVALRPSDRSRYVALQRSLTMSGARVLLNVLNYDPAVMQGPPWCVPPEAVEALWGEEDLAHLDRTSLYDEEPRWKASAHDWFDRDLYRVQRR